MNIMQELDISNFYLHQNEGCNKSLSKDGKDGKDDAIANLSIDGYSSIN